MATPSFPFSVRFLNIIKFQMLSYKVPDLNSRLQELKKIFEQETNLFKLNIETKTERFTEEDQRDFRALLDEIKRDVMDRL